MRLIGKLVLPNSLQDALSIRVRPSLRRGLGSRRDGYVKRAGAAQSGACINDVPAL